MSIRVTSLGHAVFAITVLGLGIVGVVYSDFVPIWTPRPPTLPAHRLLLYVGPAISLVTGIGLLVRQTAAVATRVLLATLFLWLLLFRLPNFFRAPPFDACWSVFPLIAFLAGAWVLYVWFATAWDRKYLGFISGNSGLHTARVLYGLSLVFFGAAHFIDVKDTLSLIPAWIPAHLFWTYFTGGTFIAAGIAVVIGLFARLAAVLSTLQIGLFLVLVWLPILAAGSKIAFQWSEAIVNVAILAAAWAVSDSIPNQGPSKSRVFGSGMGVARKPCTPTSSRKSPTT
jgi:uncharacterized membrane protein YphA (DoxX/SURF4 family)